MKIAIVGAGAVGGYLAARLAQAGHEVSALARGATLAALRSQGLRLLSAESSIRIDLAACSDRASDLGVQELVVVAVKGQSLPALAGSLSPLFGRDSLLLTAMNGVPWWFLQTDALADRLPAVERSLASVDPTGTIASALPLAQVIGGVVHLSASTVAPGVVRHASGERLIIGEPAGGDSERVQRLARALSVTGLRIEASTDIRQDIWFKLWGNMTMNPVSALTGATCERILDEPLVAAYMLRTMKEAADIGALIGCPIAQSGEERMALTRQLGAIKTSMLQDSEAGRTLELDALVGAVREIGRKVGVATPNIDALLGLTRLMAATRGLHSSTAGRPSA